MGSQAGFPRCILKSALVLDAQFQNLLPTFFFAPAQIAKRNKEWGPGVLYNKAGEASARLARSAASEITVERISGADAIADTWRDFLDNKVAPSRGIMASL